MPKSKQTSGLEFKKNLYLYYGAVGVILLGYVFLSLGDANSFTSLTLGPVVLVIGYLVVMPIALLSGVGRKKAEDDTSTDKDKSGLSPKKADSTS